MLCLVEPLCWFTVFHYSVLSCVAACYSIILVTVAVCQLWNKRTIISAAKNND